MEIKFFEKDSSIPNALSVLKNEIEQWFIANSKIEVVCANFSSNDHLTNSGPIDTKQMYFYTVLYKTIRTV